MENPCGDKQRDPWCDTGKHDATDVRIEIYPPIRCLRAETGETSRSTEATVSEYDRDPCDKRCGGTNTNFPGFAHRSNENQISHRYR